jgi:hypothetical protein
MMQRPARSRATRRLSTKEQIPTTRSSGGLLNHVRGNNGRAGMLGVSYLGWTTIMGALEPHPALKAFHPQRLRPICGSG